MVSIDERLEIGGRDHNRPAQIDTVKAMFPDMPAYDQQILKLFRCSKTFILLSTETIFDMTCCVRGTWR